MNRTRNSAATVIAVIVTVVILLAASLFLRVVFRGVVRDAGSAWNRADVTGEFRSLDLRTVSCDLYLYRSDDGRCTVYYSGWKGGGAETAVEDGVLRVTETDHRAWFQRLLGGRSEDSYISVYLPGDRYDALAAETVSGDIDITDSLVLGTVTLSTTSGDVWVYDAAADSLSIQTVSGGVSLYETAADSIELDTVSGDVSVTLKEDMNYDLHTTSGNIYAPVPDRDAGPFRVTTVSGDIWVGVE